jgi:tetratricopeptide (TPR) repeat protein
MTFFKSPLLVSLFILALTVLSSWAEETNASFKLGERFFGDSLYNLAIEQYQKHLALAPASEQQPLALYKLGLSYYRSANYPEAVRHFEDFVKRFPNSDSMMDALFFSAEARKQNHDYKEASEWYYLVWSRYGGSKQAQQALFEAANCALLDGNSERAVELYDTFLRRFPKESDAAEVCIALVKLSIEKKDFPAAQEVLAKAQGFANPSKQHAATLLYLQARLAHAMQNPQAALKAFESWHKQPDTPFENRLGGYEEYIALLVELQNYDKTLPLFEYLEKGYQKQGEPFPLQLRKKWAQSALFDKNYDVAVKQYEAILAQQPPGSSLIKIKEALADAFIGKGDFSQAIEMLQAITREDSSQTLIAHAFLKIGDLYYRKGLFLSAIPAYRRCLQYENGENNDAVQFRIASIYQNEFKRFSTALREYAILLERYPTSTLYPRALFASAECHEALQEYALAVSRYSHLLEIGASGTLSDSARQRIEYLQTFVIKDGDAAVSALAELLESETTERLSRARRAYLLATIYQNHLKEYRRALSIYEDLYERGTELPDSIKAELLYRMASNNDLLAKKATYEKNLETATHLGKNAVELFHQVVDKYGLTSWSDAAAYQLLLLNNPNIADYESFLTTYPQSRYRAQVLFAIAQHYEKHASTVDAQFSRKALEAYVQLWSGYASGDLAESSLLGLCRNYFFVNKLDSAVVAAELFVKRFPQSLNRPEALYYSAMAERARNNPTQAAELLRTVLYQFPYSPFADEARFELGNVQLESGKLFEAADNLRSFLEMYGDGALTAAAQLALARCYSQMGESQKAALLLQQLLKQEESLRPAIRSGLYKELALIAQQDGDINKALEFYKKVLADKDYAQRSSVYLQAAKLYFENRIYPDASLMYQSALSVAQSSADSLQGLKGAILSLIMSGSTREADKLMVLFKQLYPDRQNDAAEIIYHEGLYLIIQKSFDKAIKRFEYIEVKYAKTPVVDDAVYQIALCNYFDGKREVAQKQFSTFTQAYPQSDYVPRALFKLGMVYHEQNDFARAAELFIAATTNKHIDAETRLRALHNAATDYQKASGWLDAAATYKKIIKLNPEQTPESSILLRTGFCLVQASRFEEALDYFKSANINPAAEDKPEIQYWLGSCYAKLGQHQKAITEYLKVPYLYAGIGKWGVTAEFEAARLYERVQEYERARSLYKKIVKSDGEHGEFGKSALEQLTRLDNLLGQAP